jgi:hypothetical protein
MSEATKPQVTEKTEKTEKIDKVAVENDLSKDTITEKYKEAAKIANSKPKLNRAYLI